MVKERGGKIRVDVVYAYEVIFDEDFAFFGDWNWEVDFILKDIDATCVFDQDAFHGFGE